MGSSYDDLSNDRSLGNGNNVNRAAESTVNEDGTLAATTVAVAGLTLLGAAIDVRHANRLFAAIDNQDASAILFDAFEIQASYDNGATYETIKSAAGDYTSPQGLLIDASGDLTTLAASASGNFSLDVQDIDFIKLMASANTTQSVGVTGSYSLK